MRRLVWRWTLIVRRHFDGRWTSDNCRSRPPAAMFAGVSHREDSTVHCRCRCRNWGGRLTYLNCCCPARDFSINNHHKSLHVDAYLSSRWTSSRWGAVRFFWGTGLGGETGILYDTAIAFAATLWFLFATVWIASAADEQRRRLNVSGSAAIASFLA